MIKKIIFIGFIIIAILSCSSNKAINRMNSDQKWEAAESYFNNGKYTRAIPYYEHLVLERSSIYVAEAQFKLGECYFNKGKHEDFIDAIFEYQEYLRLFSDGRLAADVQFRIAQSYANLSLGPEFDQDDTNRAIEHFNRFIERYAFDSRVPEAYRYINEMQLKLLEKVYLTGYIYYKTKDYPAAELYFNEIIALANRNELEKKSYFYIALIHIERQDAEQAMMAIEHLRTYFPDSKELRKAESRYKKINSRLFRLFYSL